MKKYFTKEISIAVITIISLVLLYFGINYLKGINIFKPSNVYYTKMPNVNELQISSPVYVDGFKVGLVNSIDFNYYDQGKGFILVQISLDKAMKIPVGSYTELKSGLTAGAYLDLMMNKYVSEYCNVGDTIDGVAKTGLMDKIADNIMPSIETLLPRLDSILAGIQLLVNHPALTQSFEQLALTTVNLRQTTEQLEKILATDAPQVVGNMKNISSDLSIFTNQLKTVDLNTSFLKLDTVLCNLDRFSMQLNNKDNSLGLLMNDCSLYLSLDSAAMSANRLLLDLKENPKRYVHFSLF